MPNKRKKPANMAELHMKLLLEKERLEAESLELQWEQSKIELARMKRQERTQKKIHQRHSHRAFYIA